MIKLTAVTIGLAAVPLFAQAPEPGKAAVRESRTFDIRVVGPGESSGPISVFSLMGGGGGVVKGSPYSADTLTESVQVLGDGNRITRQNKSSFYRDAEGRTRRETSIQGLGPLGKTKEPLVSITIEDPVAKTHYTLDTKSKTAQKMTMPGMPSEMMGAIRRAFPGGAPGANADILFGPVTSGRVANGTVMTWSHSISEEHKTSNANNEDLGIRTIEGVAAKGTRHTMTIPAGEVGNERPIEVVTETWYSDQLKTAVLTIHKDPRFGETTTKLVNVRLGDPPRNLFEVPADYKLNEGPTVILDRKIGKAEPVEIKEII